MFLWSKNTLENVHYSTCSSLIKTFWWQGNDVIKCYFHTAQRLNRERKQLQRGHPTCLTAEYLEVSQAVGTELWGPLTLNETLPACDKRAEPTSLISTTGSKVGLAGKHTQSIINLYSERKRNRGLLTFS